MQMQTTKEQRDEAIKQSRKEELDRLTEEAQAGDLKRTINGMEDHDYNVTEKKVGNRTHVVVEPRPLSK